MDTRSDIPGTGNEAGQLQAETAYLNKMAAEPTLRQKLEDRRNRLMTQLYQLEEALRLLSTDPNAEKNYEILRRAKP